MLEFSETRQEVGQHKRIGVNVIWTPNTSLHSCLQEGKKQTPQLPAGGSKLSGPKT